MSDQEKSLLVIKSPSILQSRQREILQEAASVLAEKLGYECVVLDGGMDADVHHSPTLLIDALHAQTAAINGLAQSNQQVIALLTDVVAELHCSGGGDGDDDASVRLYLDGSPVDGL